MPSAPDVAVAREPRRLAVLRRLQLPSAGAAATFDRLSRIAARLLDTPVALVVIVREDDEVFQGSFGLPAPMGTMLEVPSEYTYCRYVVATKQPLAVEDAREHPQFRDDSALLELGVVAYLGIPLTTAEGDALGSFIVIDTRPRAWGAEDIALLTDLAASAMTEVELRGELVERARAEARSERILESITDAFIGLDGEWRFSYVNSAAEALLQRPSGELLGTEIWEAFPEAVGTEFERNYRKAVAEGVTVSFEEHYAPLDMWVQVNAYPSEEGLSVYFQDVSDRRRAAARLAAAEAHYRRLVTTVPQAVYVLDMAGRFTELNPAAEGILDRTARDLLRKRLGEVIAPASLEVVERVFFEVISGISNDVSFEASVVRPGGEQRLLSITATAIRENGRITGLHGVARDVTAERETELALRESEEKFRQIADNVREVFWIFTPDFSEALYLSPAYERTTGRSLESIYENPRSFLEPVHPEDLPGLLVAMERVSREELAIGVEFRLTHADGSQRWFLARGYPVRDEAGRVYRVAGTSEDITERKTAELAHRQAERRLQQILDALPVGVVLADDSGQLTWHNPAEQRIWGGMRMVGLDGYEEYRGWWPETGERLRGEEWALARALGGEEVPGDVVEIESFDGVRKTTLTSATPLRDDAGRITGAVVVQQDITQERSREAHQRLLALGLDQLREGVFLLTTEGRYVYLNETYRQIFGIPEDSPMPESIGDLAENDEVRGMQRQILRAVAEQGHWAGRIRRKRISDGREIPLDLMLGRVASGRGGPDLLFGIIQDATEQIEGERQLRRVERLASLGTLIGGVAHELNNPLHAIRNFAELMLMEGRSEADQEALEIMRREADRAAKVVSDLRVVARQTQESQGDREPVSLNEVVRHVLRVRRYSLETANVEIREDLAEDLPAVLANRGELEQVVMNLVVNAEQAMSAVGEKRRLVVRSRRTAEGAAVHVVDSGPGIATEHLGRIFDPFFTTKAPGEGTGLGLSLVHSIVTEHGGRIQVESERAKGAAFRVDLPAAPAEAEHAEAPRRVVAERRLRVLVVDDELSIRRLSERYLRQLGHEVETASEGERALEMLRAGEYDAILSDLRMPGMGGEELLERLRAEGGGKERRLIFITGDVVGSMGVVANAGVPVVTKPVQMQELLRALEVVAGRARGHTVVEEP